MIESSGITVCVWCLLWEEWRRLSGEKTKSKCYRQSQISTQIFTRTFSGSFDNYNEQNHKYTNMFHHANTIKNLRKRDQIRHINCMEKPQERWQYKIVAIAWNGYF